MILAVKREFYSVDTAIHMSYSSNPSGVCAPDPVGRRVCFLDDGFYLTPDAPKGGSQLIRNVNDTSVRLQFIADTGASNSKLRDLVLNCMRTQSVFSGVHGRFLLGDLVYEVGVVGSKDNRIAKRVSIYAQDTEAFLALGNHDLGKKKKPVPDALAYLNPNTTHDVSNSSGSRSLTMPATYYDIVFSNKVHVLVLNTNVLASDKAQQVWLENRLSTSPFPYKVVVGHHPLFSAGPEHLTPPPFKNWLREVLRKNEVSFTVFGHEHNLQVSSPNNDGDPYQFIVGAGSKLDLPAGANRAHPVVNTTIAGRSVMAIGMPGFLSCDISDQDIKFELLGVTHKGVPTVLYNQIYSHKSLRENFTFSEAKDDMTSGRFGTILSVLTLGLVVASLIGISLKIRAINARKANQCHDQSERQGLVSLHSIRNYGTVSSGI